MKTFLEPIFLNEKMLLNLAAYLFKGVSLDKEITNENTKTSKVKGSVGFKFLQDLISPVSLNAEHENINKQYSKTARIYTLGGLHMSVIDELEKAKYLENISFNPQKLPKANSFIKLTDLTHISTSVTHHTQLCWLLLIISFLKQSDLGYVSSLSTQV